MTSTHVARRVVAATVASAAALLLAVDARAETTVVHGTFPIVFATPCRGEPFTAEARFTTVVTTHVTETGRVLVAYHDTTILLGQLYDGARYVAHGQTQVVQVGDLDGDSAGHMTTVVVARDNRTRGDNTADDALFRIQFNATVDANGRLVQMHANGELRCT